MKTLLCCSTAPILLPVSAMAQNNEPTVQPNELTTSAKQKPPLQRPAARRNSGR